MADQYEMIEVEAAELELSEKSGTRNIDLGEALGCEKMRPRMWFVEPGHDRKRYHSHEEQEEFYYVLSGPGRMRIAGETHTIPEGTAVRISPETPRKTFNDTDREHVWLVVGAPAVEDPGIVHEE
ncbi:cupin domain-containing protein [Halobellus litoreus]|uniref:Cupin domain-containing protein n=1 Tax=Halobellus litoreus TaxID=755310 RepID=A0ABD6DUG4_9EURY|nr:cupin domain-containing protein [Halobellus litoreus]